MGFGEVLSDKVTEGPMLSLCVHAYFSESRSGSLLPVPSRRTDSPEETFCDDPAEDDGGEL